MSEPERAPDTDAARAAMADLHLMAATDVVAATGQRGAEVIQAGLRALAALRAAATEARWVPRRTAEVEQSMLPGELAVSFDGYRAEDAHLVVAATRPAVLDAAEAFLRLALGSDDGALRVAAMDAAGEWVLAAVESGALR